MDLLETMQNRRSVRSYTGEKIAKEKLKKIFHAVQFWYLHIRKRQMCGWRTAPLS